MRQAPATVIIARGPYRSINPPAKGAVRPKMARRRPCGADSSPRLQPRSSDIGTIRTLGTPIEAEAKTVWKKARKTIAQP
jgi:hypothetical protein